MKPCTDCKHYVESIDQMCEKPLKFSDTVTHKVNPIRYMRLDIPYLDTCGPEAKLYEEKDVVYTIKPIMSSLEFFASGGRL